VFTSVNGVEFFFSRLFEKGFDVRALHRINTAAIGPATARSLFKFGLKSDIVPDSFQAESVVEAFRKVSINGRRFLLPRAEEARPVLPVELVKMGAQVDEIIAYRTGQDRSGTDLLVNAFEKGSVDMVTFTSSSTVRNFRSLFSGDEVFELMKRVTVAAIGPITADTARELGFQVDIIADEFTIPGLCRAISTYFRNTAVDSA
jgi:uroporphyrinogen III methyltransferase/synthase